MGLKDIYYSWEDRWYGLLDKIDEKIPLYKVIEPIDKVVPSFALFLLIVALLVVWGAFTLLALTAGSTFSVEVLDESGNPLPNALVKAFAEGNEVYSDESDEFGKTKEQNFPLGTVLELRVMKDGFEEYTETITLAGGSIRKKVNLVEITLREINILLKDEYNQPIREPVTLYFTCRNPDVRAPSSLTVSNGQATVIEPANCNGLIVNLESERYGSMSSIEITQDTQTIYLQEVTPANGTIRVELKFNQQLISTSEIVYLYKDNGVDGSGPIDSQTTSNGIATFSKPPGSYFVKTGGEGKYGTAQSNVFTLVSGSQQTIALELQENIVGYVKLKIVNKNSNAGIGDALVTLKIGAQDAVPSKSTDSNGSVQFAVTEDAEFIAAIDHEDYCFTTVRVSISDAVQTIKLDPYTPACGGILKVKVLDQSGKLVKNATVSLHNEDGFSLGYRTQTTDINGTAIFNGVRSGDYKAFAFKGSSSGWSEASHFIERAADKTILTVVLTVPAGTVRVRVLDADGLPLQFAQVAFVDVVDNKPIGGGSLPVEDINGTVELKTAADKQIYIIASKEGYTNYTSVVYPVIPSSMQEITAVLEKEIISGEIGIKFLGMVNESGQNVSVLSQGKRYKARFQLRVPVNKDYDSIGMHIRAGDKAIMELDKIVLKGLNVPGKATVIKATSFNPANGYDADSANVSSDEAKWANIEWGSFVSGLINVEAEIRVKETAKIEDELYLFYRAWAEKDGRFVREPADTTLSNTAGVDESLYANTHKQIFQVGAETVCDDKFCFSATILDLTENLAESVVDSYSAKIFREYRLNFSIINNSKSETDSYIGAEMRVRNENEALLLTDYSVYGAQGTNVSGSVDGSDTAWIGIGNLNPNVSVLANFKFTPQNTGFAPILIEIRAGQRIHFSKTVAINVSARKQFDVVVVPELLPSGIENKITASVKERANNLEVAEARVKVKDKFGNVIAQKLTNTKGIAILTLPALSPGEKLFLEVEKFDFEVYRKELRVDSKIVSIKPERLGAALNAKTKPETEDKFSIENKTSFDIVLSDLRLEGRFRSLLDEERIRNWLYTFEGETIKAGEEREYSLKTFLSESGKRVTEAKTLQGELLVGVSAYQSIWNFTVPVTVSIGLGGEVDEPTCFNITKKEWKGFTEGNPIEIEFEVQNNCGVESVPVTLRDIEAKVLWQSNPIGEFELRTEQADIELRSGYFRRFAPQLAPGEAISVVISFSPDAGVDGIAKAEIAFQAGNPTDTKTQILTDKLTAELTSVNLIDCVYVDKDVLVIEPQKSDKFTIETLGCGPRTDIKLESELTLGKETLTMQSKDKKDVEVFAEKNMPGQYPVKIFAKGADQVEEKLIKTVRVRITSGKCIELSKYEFEIFDNPNNPYDGYDTAEIINRCYNKPVTITIKWDEHDWGKAIKTGVLVGLVTGLVGGVAAKAQGRTFLFGELPSGEGETQAIPSKQTADEIKEKPKDIPTPPTMKSSGESNPFIAVGGAVAGGATWLWDNTLGRLFSGPSDGATPSAEEGSTTPPSGGGGGGATQQPETTGGEPTATWQGATWTANALVAQIQKLPSVQSAVADPDGRGIAVTMIGGSKTRVQIVGGEWVFGSSSASDTGAGSSATTPASGSGATQPPETTGGEPTATDACGGRCTGSLICDTETKECKDVEYMSGQEKTLGSLAYPTGFAPLGGGLLGGLLGGLGNSILGSILGPPSFINWGLQGALFGTLWTYSQQEEGSFSFVRTLPDLEAQGIELLMPGAKLENDKIQEEPSEDIIAQLLEEQYTEPRMDNPGLSVQYIKVGFINKTGVVQPDPATPLYRTLRVDGERIDYVTTYEFKEEKEPEIIEEKGREDYKQRFRLQFNAFNPIEPERQAGPIPNCKLGNKVGVTGKSALPKVLFEWNWSAIDEYGCDEGSPDYIYCDATQFSIEVLKKVNALQEFIAKHKPFECPSPGSAKAVKEQQMVGTAYDVAITKIEATKAGTDANVLVVAESNNNKKMDAQLVINVKNKDTNALVKSCTKQFELISRSIENCLFTNLQVGVYNIEARLTPELCTGCENNDTDNDSIKVELAMGELGIKECEPYSTLRLKQFLEASEIAGTAAWSQQEKEKVLKLLKFNAYLIKDAYTEDFRKDFHEFCVHNSFFDCPNYYLEEDGLGEYFSSTNKFLFDYAQAPHAPVDAGKYEVTLDIEFNNDEWNLFSGGEPDAVIKVRMSQLSTPEPNSPFYYLPFDGRIGLDSANGRQGYGMNFRQTSEETIKINNSTEQPVISTNSATSTPVFGGWIKAGFEDQFRILNIDKRGILLDVQAGADETGIVLSPSYATPVIMNVNYAKGEEAYGFYSIEINQSPQAAFTKMIPWSGIGVNCKDFEDNPMTDAWSDTWDVHGGISGNIRCARGTDIQDYGIEWCNPIRQGGVFLQSVVFTPQGSSSLMQRSTYADDMTLVGVDNAGTQIALNGIPGMPFNSYGTSSIDSVESVFNLVKDGYVCLIGTDNRISNQFFWNPKVVLEELAQQRSKAEEECIRAT